MDNLQFIGGWGVLNREIVSLVRACVPAVWLPSGIASKVVANVFPFPFRGGVLFPFPFWGAELSLFPSLPRKKTSYPILVGLVGTLYNFKSWNLGILQSWNLLEWLMAHGSSLMGHAARLVAQGLAHGQEKEIGAGFPRPLSLAISLEPRALRHEP